MKFNKYIWELYRNSEGGNQKIKDSKAVDVFSLKEAVMVAFEPESLLQLRSLGLDTFIQNDLVNLQKLYHECFLEREFSIRQADEIFTKWVEEGLVFKGYTLIEKEEYSRWMEEIETISNALYAAFPDFFFPYFFLHNFDEFQVICLEFEIPLPEIPPKKNKAAKEGLWIYQSVKSDFKFGKFEHYTWNELNAPDAFHHVLKSIGKKSK